MPVHLADENPPVLVANPPGDRHEVNPAHNRIADEVVPAIVEAESLEVFGQSPFLSF
jgi:hypothetical protein